MSKTKRGSKPVGFEYWGKRGIDDKKTTKKKERAKSRVIEYKALHNTH